MNLPPRIGEARGNAGGLLRPYSTGATGEVVLPVLPVSRIYLDLADGRHAVA
ncbi:MAG: hypothetical protein QM628_10580 [Propionicimonas sp.]